MRVLLIIPPILYARNPPIGIAYIAAYLKVKNYEVKSWDLNTEHLIVNDCDDLFWSAKNCAVFFEDHKNLFEDWVEKILNYKPHIVGFSVWNTTEYCSIKLSEMIKSRDKDILIVFGGPQCAYEGKLIIQNPAVDIVVCREGEKSFSEIIEIFKINGKVDFCPGCLIKKDGKIIDCGFRPEINDLDTLPYPDFLDLRIEKYLFNDYIPVSFSRGCLWGCAYCATNYRWKKFRTRAPENIYHEIMYRLKEYPTVNKFQFCDPAVNQNLDVLLRLCDLIVSNRVNVELHGFAQIKPEMDLEMLKKIRKSGFVMLDYGVESGSQKVINSMGRKYNIEDAERVIKDSYNAGINIVVNFIVGFPNETEEDFYETIRFIERIKKYVSNIIPASECGVLDSYIQSHPEKFNVFIPENNSLEWRTEDGKNTHEERLRRQKIFNDFVKGLRIPSRSSAEDRESMKNLYG